MTTIKEFAAKHRITLQVSGDLGFDWAREHGVRGNEWTRTAHWYDVALYNGKTHRKLALPPFGTGTGIAYVPSVEDVLNMWATIAADAEGAENFEDWASNLERTDDDYALEDYHEAVRVSGRLAGLLGHKAYQELLYETERL